MRLRQARKGQYKNQQRDEMAHISQGFAQTFLPMRNFKGLSIWLYHATQKVARAASILGHDGI
jgi:hypothetical protein